MGSSGVPRTRAEKVDTPRSLFATQPMRIRSPLPLPSDVISSDSDSGGAGLQERHAR